MVRAQQQLTLLPEARFRLNRRRQSSAHLPVYQLLDQVKDPEIPVLSIWQLGILQDIRVADNELCIVITPTYSGCPAISMIKAQISEVLHGAGIRHFHIEVRLSPPWTTDWLDADARRLLKNYGIAPPDTTACPQCGSAQTEVISEFGSTACKALMRCLSCHEPFDYFREF